MIEIWKDIEGYEGFYQISNKGKVKSLKRIINKRDGRKCYVKEKILKQVPDKDGYAKCSLTCFKGRRKPIIVHRVIAKNFICNPQNKPQVNHIDGNKKNNDLNNLEWVTLSENRIHAYATGLQNGKAKEGSRNNLSKLNEMQVLTIKTLLHNKWTCAKIAKSFSVTQSNISYIKSGKTWKHLGI